MAEGNMTHKHIEKGMPIVISLIDTSDYEPPIGGRMLYLDAAGVTFTRNGDNFTKIFIPIHRIAGIKTE